MTTEAGTNLPSEPDAGYTPFLNVGFNAHVGPIFCKPPEVNEAAEKAHFYLETKAEHANGDGYIHGGLMMGMADTILGARVRIAVEDQRCSTVSLNCDFVAPAKIGDRITGVAWVTRKTRSVVFVSGTLNVGGTIVMSATGIWKIVGDRASS